MLPLFVASYLNATSAGAGFARAGLLVQSTDPSAVPTWASAKPSDCSLTEECDPAPAAGDSGCTATHGEGAVAWIAANYIADSDDWLLYCTGDTWIVSDGNTRSEFEAGGQAWARTVVDIVDSQPDDPVAWLSGSHVGSRTFGKCSDPAPSGWRNGGALAICLEALANGAFVGGICSQGKDDDTPACATSFIPLDSVGALGTPDCPT